MKNGRLEAAELQQLSKTSQILDDLCLNWNKSNRDLRDNRVSPLAEVAQLAIDMLLEEYERATVTELDPAAEEIRRMVKTASFPRPRNGDAWRNDVTVEVIAIDDLPDLPTVKQWAEAFNVSPMTVYRMCRDGQLHSVKIRGVRRICRDKSFEMLRMQER